MRVDNTHAAGKESSSIGASTAFAKGTDLGFSPKHRGDTDDVRLFCLVFSLLFAVVVCETLVVVVVVVFITYRFVKLLGITD